MLSLAVLGSGSGTNFQSLADAIESGRLDAKIKCVISDVEDAYILERARKLGIPEFYVDCAPFKTKLAGEAEKHVLRILREHEVDFIALAGFMRIVKDELLNLFSERIVNIHPALLPAFPGLESWKQALEYGAKYSGCTVHFVDSGIDTGPIIEQSCVRVLGGDTPQSLHERIQEEEHKIYPEALQGIASGRISVQGRRVIWL